ncbi:MULTISPECIES: sensor histidine kinase [Micromonospora]|uniref:histidine kinase n=1 Tax=Micromonospora solifontis TaxID=2487138 RepID=A0ABX9WCM2_9ACTN|nr:MULTISPECIES: histidine kinase [Micromonospora]NES17093.1 two-component sensor histidine kinase [Micromonospora sp. PPF5-17B]NES39397.1 two-component sensor histidine kinase [Micromonospora solifontis]NES57099.1 two-component sensor histidine kinase [Micromonospora sp. PPF5-6]RNL89124.1 two-component sensor histidine kinase [Micromonospora solifontis]
MTVAGVVRPLVRGSTWRRGVFLLLGGVLALPYALLAATFVQLLGNDGVPRPVGFGLLLVGAAIAAVPVFLAGSRALEIAAARALLAVDLPDPAVGHRVDRETRLRAALWIALHLVSGGLVLFAAISAFPMALVFLAGQLGLDTGATAGDTIGSLSPDNPVAAALAGVAVLVALGYAVAGLGALAASMAPVLLGPSQGERIAALEVRAARLAERNRLARELHDSVGHALTVATLQAGAARELLDADPEFTRRALRAIEETSRHAMDDLDHVLGLLRESGEEPAPIAPQRTLGQLDRLVADTRAAGLQVDAQVSGAVAELPAALSREGYRIVQEGLTNAARHGRGAVTLRVGVPPDGLEIELVNGLRGGTGPRGGGRGLDGMRERVLLLGGRLDAGPDGDRWRVRASLPVPRGESR